MQIFKVIHLFQKQKYQINFKNMPLFIYIMNGHTMQNRKHTKWRACSYTYCIEIFMFQPLQSYCSIYLACTGFIPWCSLTYCMLRGVVLNGYNSTLTCLLAYIHDWYIHNWFTFGDKAFSILGHRNVNESLLISKTMIILKAFDRFKNELINLFF